jgi:THO complex subunit 2
MQEQERLANEEAEKRLKAALTAKREPASKASPQLGSSAATQAASETKVSAHDGPVSEDVNMEAEVSPTATVPASREVVSLHSARTDADRDATM